ncbi:hypothetical protein M441DRAFT_155126, partial [Trichoderma asperellum CBS 433.97]
TIIFNYIINLLGLKELLINIVYNSIFIVINKLFKQAYFLLYKKFYIIKDLVYFYIKYIFIKYKLLVEIILNKENTFTFKF